MSYLARLKQIETEKTFADAPPPVLTKPTQPGSVSSVSSIPEHIEKNHAANDGERIDTENTATAAEHIHDLTAKVCPDCRHFARPGMSSGYCGGRDDLPRAYGENHPLRRLPADRGASCDHWQATQ